MLKCIDEDTENKLNFVTLKKDLYNEKYNCN